MESQELKRFVLVHKETDDLGNDQMMAHEEAARANEILVATDEPWRWLPFAEKSTMEPMG